jgi:hypothetical protein
MNGLAIAAAPLGAAGLGTLTQGFPDVRPETIRIDAVLNIVAETAAERASAEAALTIGLDT